MLVAELYMCFVRDWTFTKSALLCTSVEIKKRIEPGQIFDI